MVYMRKLSLVELNSEMADISRRGDSIGNRFNELMEKIRNDMRRGDPEEVRLLRDWWKVYRGLSTYIYR